MIHISNKKRVALFGAGQAGMMMKKWLPQGAEAICFIDNDSSKTGSFLDGIPVRTADEALAEDPDLIIIAVLNRDAENEIRKQIRTAGYDGEIRSASEFRAMMDIRLSALRLIAERIKRQEGPADQAAVAELGVYKGEFAAEINRLFPKRSIYLFDTFAGFDEEDLRREQGNTEKMRGKFADTDEETVKKALPYPEKAIFVKGRFPESLAELDGADDIEYALVSLDPDLYEPALKGMEYFYPRLVSGGAIIVHDYNSIQFPGIRKAVDRYEEENGGLRIVPLMDLHGTAVIIKP